MAGIAIVGDATSVAGFRPLGFAVFPVEEPVAAREAWPTLVSGEFAVVFLTEPVYAELEELISEVGDKPVPAFTVIPGAGSKGGVGEAKLARAIERALGTSMPISEGES